MSNKTGCPTNADLSKVKVVPCKPESPAQIRKRFKDGLDYMVEHRSITAKDAKEIMKHFDNGETVVNKATEDGRHVIEVVVTHTYAISPPKRKRA